MIVGGAQAGPTAAARARETDEKARITLIERSKEVSYAVAGLVYHLSGEVPDATALDREKARFFRDVYDVDVRTGVSVTAIDPKAHTVKAGRTLRYDSLIFAGGAASTVPDVEGLAGATNVFQLRKLADLRGIDRVLRAGGRRVAVLGGGFFGVEAADALLRRGCEVTVVEHGPRILPQFGDDAAHEAASALRRAGAKVRAAVEVTAAARRGKRVHTLALSKGQPIECDLVLVATGVAPRTELLGEAGVRLHDDGTVKVDARCRTSRADVYACGVCVSVKHAVSGQPFWLAQSAQADKTAQVAGNAAAGGDARMGPVLGTAIVRAGDLVVARTGLTQGPGLTTSRVHTSSHDPWFPAAQAVSITVCCDARGRVVGAEAWGGAGTDKRIDVLATAILGKLRADQLATLDLAYAPPFSAARDPVNVAGTVAASAHAELARAWSPAAVAESLGELTIVDVRSPAERRAGTLDGARGVPLAKVRDEVAELKKLGKAAPLVFVSGTGNRSYLAARIARAAGVRDAGFLSGGLTSWAAEGRRLRS